MPSDNNVLKPAPDTGLQTETSARRSIGSILVGAISSAWNPLPLSAPSVDPELPRLPAIERIAEVFRFSVLQLEYSLSSGGGLRSWLKLNLLIGLLIAIPAILVLPPITFILGTFATWSDYLATTAENLFRVCLAIVGIAALITGGLFLIRLLRR